MELKKKPLIWIFSLFGIVLSGFFFFARIFLSIKGGVTFEAIFLCTLNIEYSISFSLDLVSSGYSTCIIIVYFCILIFTEFYIKGTTNYRRFIYLMALFVVSILILVMSDSFITLIIGWDGLGITSFCLVIFYERSNSLSSGVITILTNRVGDSIYIISFFYLFVIGGFSGNFFNNERLIFLILLPIGAITKRAQIPFCSWLPAAISAPTPVSSLVHSSTLVTAGVYLIIRYNYIFFYKNLFLSFICVLTMLVAGVSAVIESDLKKLVAMSTLRQLGIIMFSVSLGLWKLTIFHIITHSFFKSIIFLSTGGIIFSLIRGQDFRQVQFSLNNKISIILRIIRILCISGFPFLLGFYSKDLIIYGSLKMSGLIINLFFTIACVITIVYRIRFITFTYCFNLLGFSVKKQNNNIIFAFSSIILILINITLGPFIYLIGPLNNINLKVIEIFLGFLIIFISPILLKILPLFKIEFHLFNRLIFINWLRNGGMSKMIHFTNISKIEKTWFETINKISTVINNFKKLFFLEYGNRLKYLLTITPIVIFILI